MFCLVKQTCLKNVRATHDMLLKLLASRTTQKHWTNPMQNAHVHIKDFIQGMGVQGNLRVAPLYDISHLINDAWCVIYEMRMILAAIGEIPPTATRRHRSFRGTWRLTLGSNHCMNMYPASQVIFKALEIEVWILFGSRSSMKIPLYNAWYSHSINIESHQKSHQIPLRLKCSQNLDPVSDGLPPDA